MYQYQSRHGLIPDLDRYGTEEVFSEARWFSLIGPRVVRWTISKPSRRIPFATAKTVIERALAEWSKPVQLRFQYSPSASTGTIAFEFHTGNHGDGHPFISKGRILGHAFPPPPLNSEPIAGDVHINDEVPWDDEGSPDLYSTVLHEVGHALGLDHSNRPGNVMYRYYIERLSTL